MYWLHLGVAPTHSFVGLKMLNVSLETLETPKFRSRLFSCSVEKEKQRKERSNVFLCRSINLVFPPRSSFLPGRGKEESAN